MSAVTVPRSANGDSIPYPIAYGLPKELVEGALRRLSLASLGLAGTLVAVMALHHVARETGNLGLARSLMGGVWGNVVATAVVVLSVAMMAAARSKRLPATLVLDLSMVYAVVSGFGVAMLEHLVYWPSSDIIRGVSWVCIWVVLFPVMVPATFGKTLLTVLATAAMVPLSYIVLVAGGKPPAQGVTIAGLFLPLIAAVFLAMFVSRAFYKLGRNYVQLQQMGNYRLVERLGQGGMGEVWKAEHRRLGRLAAVKFIRRPGAGHLDETLLRRFEREAAATAKLRSHHTVELYDFGAAEDGTLYYVMELLTGMDLDTLVNGFGPVPAGRAIFLLKQACASLAEAHEVGLIHRDIKPANLFICHVGLDYDFLKVLDFGLVGPNRKRTGSPSLTPLTAVGTVGGTPGYFAPETVLDEATADHRADLYSLGCVAYWLVTGKPVFEAESPVKLLMAHTHDQPVPPSRRTELSIPAELDALILQCLEKDPAKRPQSAIELSDRLAACETARVWTPRDARSWWETHEANRADKEGGEPSSSLPARGEQLAEAQ